MRQIAVSRPVKFNEAEHSSSRLPGHVSETNSDAFRATPAGRKEHPHASLRAELIGPNRATAHGVEAHSPSPVLASCRALVEAGHDPATPLHAYRGHTLALKVRSIGEGAKLTVEDNDIGKPVFRRWRNRAESGGAAPPVTEIRDGYVLKPARKPAI